MAGLRERTRDNEFPWMTVTTIPGAYRTREEPILSGTRGAGVMEGRLLRRVPSVNVPIKGKPVGARGQGSLSHPSVSPIVTQAPSGSENKPRQWRKQRMTANTLGSYDWRQESGWPQFWKVRETNLIFNNPQERIFNEEHEVVWDQIKWTKYKCPWIGRWLTLGNVEEKLNSQEIIYWVTISDLSDFSFGRRDSSKQTAEASRQHRERGKCREKNIYLINSVVEGSRKLELLNMEEYTGNAFFFPWKVKCKYIRKKISSFK